MRTMTRTALTLAVVAASASLLAGCVYYPYDRYGYYHGRGDYAGGYDRHTRLVCDSDGDRCYRADGPWNDRDYGRYRDGNPYD